MKTKNKIPFLLLTILVTLAFILIGCQSSPEPKLPDDSSTAVQQDTAGENGGDSSADAARVSADDDSSGESEAAGLDPLELAQQEWEKSSHANTFVVTDQGKNNSCAQCHAPTNWMPSMEDIPESCSTCKFELEPPPPYIPEEEWEDIPCLVCHEENKKGVIQSEYSWLEVPALEEYTAVETPAELCLKCHGENNLPDHGRVQLNDAHADMQCTECHQAHSTEVSCSSADCHPANGDPADPPPPGHDEAHQDVSCVACHDSSGWEVAYDEDREQWITYYSWESTIENGEEEMVVDTGLTPFTSHTVSLEVNCERCHFPDNPWDLEVEVSSP